MELWLSLTREASLILCRGSITEPDISKFQDLVVIMEEHLRKNNLKITQSTKNEMQKKKRKKKKKNLLRTIWNSFLLMKVYIFILIPLRSKIQSKISWKKVKNVAILQKLQHSLIVKSRKSRMKWPGLHKQVPYTKNFKSVIYMYA